MDTINAVLILLATLTSLLCTVLLFRSYTATAQRLLLWSALCFVFLTLNNVLVFFDVVIFPEIELRPYRLGAALVGILFLLYGFIAEAE